MRKMRSRPSATGIVEAPHALLGLRPRSACAFLAARAVLCGHRAEGAKRGMSDNADVMTKSRLCASWPHRLAGSYIGGILMAITTDGSRAGGRISQPGRQMARLFLAVALCASSPSVALAFMDQGGGISRNLATTAVGGEELVFLTWGGTGPKSERLTLFAFCADGSCDSPPVLASYIHPPSCTVAGLNLRASDRCDQNRGCLWAWELPKSRGNASYAPPTVSKPDLLPAGRVFVATTDDGGGGTVWAFDLSGHCLWANKPQPNSGVSGGFYGRPAVQELGDGDEGRLVFAPSFKSSKMHVLYDGPARTAPPVSAGDSWVRPFNVAKPNTTAGDARFGPLVECADSDCSTVRVYVGLEQGSAKRGMYAFDVNPNIPNGYRPVWTILDPRLSVRLGGVLLQSGSQRYLVANLENLAGTAVFDINRAEKQPPELVGCNAATTMDPIANTVNCFAIHPTIRGAHRSDPISVMEKEMSGIPVACSSGTDCKPVVYIGQKEGGVYGGGEVHKFILAGGGRWADGDTDLDKWYTPFDDGWQSWPACKGASIPTTSYSSPAVNPLNLHVFVGSSHDEGVYRLTQPLDRGCPCEPVAPAWFDYFAPSGWRTTAAFSQGGNRIHIGSSEDEFYTLREDRVGCPVEWCYDIGNSGNSGVCPVVGPGPACCTAACRGVGPAACS